VYITLDSPGRLPLQTPPDWLQPSMAGNVVTFVDSRFTEIRLAESVGALFKGVKNIDVQPIALRTIFTTLARQSREGTAS
jgi:ABC-2 type transport system ATP-binding protein